MIDEIIDKARESLREQNVKPCVMTLPGKLIPENYYCWLPVGNFSWYPGQINKYVKRIFPA